MTKSKHLEAPHDPSGPDCLSKLLYYLLLHPSCVLVGFFYSSHVLCSFQPHAFLYFPFCRLRICFFTSTPPVIIWTSVQMIPPKWGHFLLILSDSCPLPDTDMSLYCHSLWISSRLSIVYEYIVLFFSPSLLSNESKDFAFTAISLAFREVCIEDIQ